MKEIKFKYIWEVDGKLYPHIFTLEEIDGGKTTEPCGIYKSLPKHKLQFTGLLDKNGVEIFEGDIVKVFIEIADKKWEEIRVIKWDIQKCGFGWENTDEKGYLFHQYHEKDLEVIGNIYEDKNLLTS